MPSFRAYAIYNQVSKFSTPTIGVLTATYYSITTLQLGEFTEPSFSRHII